MPLPFLIAGIAAVAGVAGVGSGIHGGIKMKEANDTLSVAKKKQENAVELFERRKTQTNELMDSVGKQELKILKSFEEFSDTMEKIQGRPEFKNYRTEGINLPEYKVEELKEVATGAGVLLGGIGGAAAGTAGGFAAAGATTSAVMALGTASTGVAISSLSGAAATNATLAAIGGGALSVGGYGGGMALGSAILGGATLGVGLLVGGVIFNVTGSKLSDKADEAYEQAKRTEKEVDKIVRYLGNLSDVARSFKKALDEIELQYRKRLVTLNHIVNISGKVNWFEFTEEEKKLTQNTELLVGILYKMCKTSLVLKAENSDGFQSLNRYEVNGVVDEANKLVKKVENNA